MNPNWTPDRPTKPGRYEVCFGPPRGFDGYRVWVVEVWREQPSGKLFAQRGILDIPINPDPSDIDTLTEALWRPYVEPADPHVRYQQEEERDELLRKPRLSRTDQARLQELNDALRTESPEERKYLDILRRAAAHRESLRSRIEALPDLVLGSGRVIGGAVDRGAVLALLDEVTR